MRRPQLSRKGSSPTILPSSSFDLLSDASINGKKKRRRGNAFKLLIGILILVLVGVRLWNGKEKKKKYASEESKKHVIIDEKVAKERRPITNSVEKKTEKKHNDDDDASKVVEELSRTERHRREMEERARRQSEAREVRRAERKNESKIFVQEQKRKVPTLAIMEEHHHALAYWLRLLREYPENEPATIIHIDSHADMAISRAYADAQNNIFHVREHVGNSRVLEEYTEMNDFLLLAVQLGLIDHIIFIEPPWSNQFRCCVYQTNTTLRFVTGLDQRGEIRIDLAEPTSHHFIRDRFSHIFRRNGESRTGNKDSFMHKRAFSISTIAFEHNNLGQTIRDSIDLHTKLSSSLNNDASNESMNKKPYIIDVDLDAFATTSPGAMATKIRFGLEDADLEILYHMVWNFPEFSLDYLRRKDPTLRDRSNAHVFFERAARRLEADAQRILQLSDQNVSKTYAAQRREISRLAHAIDGVLINRNDVDQDRHNAIIDFAALIDKTATSPPASRSSKVKPGRNPPLRPLDARSKANLHAYLEQPFHLPDAPSIHDELDLSLEKIWRPIFEHNFFPKPLLINLARSPGYMPDHLLPLIECRVARFFRDVFDIKFIHHENRVDPARTKCKGSNSVNFRHVNHMISKIGGAPT
uniref:Uncharacterized protein n=2 Tax=Aureoumbra lagunensis TaxID=44058 RepID=A0A7S3JVF3_9STRA|mmetsp:Transcript_12533/g.18794  ORF Transcript_12533/g.18794 Transcript_12533/m.18794 type:complete len:642 (+) Transcript_12533:49-1974(+)